MAGYTKSFVVGQGRCQVTLYALIIGSDILLSLYGGNEPHIGAVAISLPHPSLSDPERTSSSTSVYCLNCHKEDELSKKVAFRVASALNRVTVVTAGIHINDITAFEIKQVLRNCEIITETFIDSFC